MTDVTIPLVEGGEETTPTSTSTIEIDNGTASKYVALSNLHKALTAGTTSQAGVLELTTDAEFTTGTDTERAITAAQSKSVAQTLTNKTLTSPVINSPTGIGIARYIIKASNETVNNGGVQDDADFLFAIAASEKWLVQLFLIVTSVSTTSDFVCGFTLPASCTMYFGRTAGGGGVGWSSAATTGSPAALSVAGGTVAVGSDNLTYGVTITAIITNSTNAGTVQFQWGQNTPTAENTVLLANSVMCYTRLA
jgi:hypothetical protein